MLNHPAPKDTGHHSSGDIHDKKHSRAYRVFKHYTKKLVNDRCEKLGPDATDAELRSISKGVFLCEPADGGGRRVYACTSCKRLCRDGKTAENKPRYRPCDPAELDLFDGVDDEDDFSSIGIGD